jgi:hypothetical protein
LWSNVKSHFENLDIGPSIASLLGIPVAKQAAGIFIDDVLILANQSNLVYHYDDLEHQKEAFVRLFEEAVGQSTNAETEQQDDQQTAVTKLLQDYNAARMKFYKQELLRNLFLAVTLVMGFWVLCVSYLWTTILELILEIQCPLCRSRRSSASTEWTLISQL